MKNEWKMQVISRLCELASNVGHQVYSDHLAHDCFCNEKSDIDFQFDPEVLAFIENAVQDKINAQGK